MTGAPSANAGPTRPCASSRTKAERLALAMARLVDERSSPKSTHRGVDLGCDPPARLECALHPAPQ